MSGDYKIALERGEHNGTYWQSNFWKNKKNRGMRHLEWKKIWENEFPSTNEQKQDLLDAPKFSLSYLMKMSAYYSTSPEDYQNNLLKIIKKARKTNESLDILEIGCGPGAALMVLKPFSKTISGVDYSPRLIEICKQVFPDGDFKVCEAINIDFPQKRFDLILSNSVFQYFPNTDYAIEVLNKMLLLLKASGAGVVLDIPDVDYEKATLEYTKKKIGDTLAAQIPGRNYYTKSIFEEFAKANAINYKIEQQEVTGYPNSSYRFNFIFWKNETEPYKNAHSPFT